MHLCTSVYAPHKHTHRPYVVRQKGNIKETLAVGMKSLETARACGAKRGPAEAAGKPSGHREPGERAGAWRNQKGGLENKEGPDNKVGPGSEARYAAE